MQARSQWKSQQVYIVSSLIHINKTHFLLSLLLLFSSSSSGRSVGSVSCSLSWSWSFRRWGLCRRSWRRRLVIKLCRLIRQHDGRGGCWKGTLSGCDRRRLLLLNFWLQLLFISDGIEIPYCRSTSLFCWIFGVHVFFAFLNGLYQFHKMSRRSSYRGRSSRFATLLRLVNVTKASLLYYFLVMLSK